MAAADYIQVAQQLYLAYFGRPADRTGLINMTNALEAAGAPKDAAGIAEAYQHKTNATVVAILDNFGASDESKALYGTGSDAKFIAAVYQQVLNRAPDLPGLDFWVAALQSGAMTRANAATQIIAAALKEGGDATDALSVANKVTVATNFTAAIDTAAEVIGYDGNEAAAAARALLQGVNSTTDPVAYQTTVDAVLDQLANPPVPVVNVALTTGVDVLTGSTGNDNFNSTMTFTASGISDTSTLNAGDILNGGVGTDSLNITISGSDLGGAFTSTPTLTNVEKVLVANSESDAVNNVTVDLSLADSALTTVGTSSSTTVNSDTTIQNVGKKVDVVMAGRGDLTVTFASGVNDGTADALNLTVNGTGIAGTNATFDTEDGVETLNITSATTTNNLTLGGIANLATVKVGGAKDISLNVNGAANTNLTTIDASAATGQVTIDASGLALANITVTGGAGATDVFSTDSNVALSSDLAKVTGFETVALNKAGGTQTASLDAAIAGVTTIDLSASSKQTLTFATGYTGATTVKVGSAGGVDSVTNTANIALTVTGAAAAFNAVTVAGGTGTDVLNISADGVGATSLASVSGVETITVAANATDSSKAVSFTVAEGTVASGKTLTIDASALTNSAATLTFAGTGETNGHFSITGGAGKDTITGGNGGDTIVSGAGADTITLGTGADSINAGEGNDTINTGANLTSADTIDGGDGTDTLVVDSVVANAFANVTNIENVKFSSSATSISLAAALTSGNVTLDLSDAAAQSLTLATGYTGATTVKVGAGDTVVNTASVALTATGTAAQFNTTVVTGGTGTDVLTIAADGTSANIAGVTNVETITLAASSTLGQGATLTGVVGSASGKTTTIDASALTDTTAGFGVTTGAAVANSGLVITGAAGVNTIDWSSAAANVTVAGGASADVLTAGTGIDSISAGAGNDTINMGGNLTFDDTIDGGAGTDTLSFSGSTIGAAGEFAHVSNVEVLKLTGTNATATIGSSTPAFTTFDLTTATKQTLTIAPGFASAVTVNVTGNGATNGDVITNSANVALTVNGKGADLTNTTITGGTGTDTLNVTADNSSITLTNVTGVEQINVKNAAGKAQAINLVSGNVAAGKTLTIDASGISDTTVGLALNGSAIAATGTLVVTGGAGTDNLTTGAGNDTINGGAGSDVIDSGAGLDIITTGTGNDIVVVNANANKLTFANVTDFTDGDALQFVTNGTASTTVPSKITLNPAATLSDYIDAAAAGNGSGNSVLSWFQFGGNTYVVADQTAGSAFAANADKIIQLNGLVDLSTSNIVAASGIATWQLGAVATLPGTTQYDTGANVTFVGGAQADTFNMGANLTLADVVTGNGGTDTLKVSGTLVDAAFVGVTGVEVLDLTAASNITLGANANTATIASVTNSGAAAITVSAAAAASVVSITGGAAADSLTGSNSASTITGGGGADTLVGGNAADVITAAASTVATTITGGTGADTMTGGSAADTFTFANTATGLPSATNFDVITNFASASDVIDFTGALAIAEANAVAASGTAAISVAGVATFHAADSTLALRLTAVAAAIEANTASAAGETVLFQFGADAYVFVSDATAGLSATDVLIKLVGVDSTAAAFDTVVIGGDNVTLA